MFLLNSESTGDYIRQGASSVVLSDAIFNKEFMDQKNFDGIFQLSKLAASQAMEALEWWGFLVSMPITNHTSCVTITCFGVKGILLTDVQK